MTQYDGIGGLFREDGFLMESVTWLKDLDYRMLKGDPQAGRLLDHVIEILEDALLPQGIKVLGIEPNGLRVLHKGIELSLKSLSHGYQTTTAFVMDLVMRMSRVFGDRFRVEHRDGRPIIPHSGVVLVDEMELHLHPSWQKKCSASSQRRRASASSACSGRSPTTDEKAAPAFAGQEHLARRAPERPRHPR